MRPALGGNQVEIILSSVLLPAPFGPRNPMISPGRTAKVTLSTASVGPYHRVAPSTEIPPLSERAAAARPRRGLGGAGPTRPIWSSPETRWEARTRLSPGAPGRVETPPGGLRRLQSGASAPSR